MAKKPSNSWKSQHAALDRRIRALARRQFGYVTRQQLGALGAGRGYVEGRLRSESLIAIHAGVYAVGVPRRDAHARCMAALLACGPDAVLSHASAAALYGLVPWTNGPVEVTTRTHRKRPGIRTHRARTLTNHDRRRHQGMWVTSPARTVLDLAPRLGERRLARAVNEARRTVGLGLHHIADLLARCGPHPGAARLRAFIEEPTAPTRSEFEDAFVAFARRFHLPRPLVNHPLNGREVDAVFPEHKLIVELDGYRFHGDRQAFEADRDHDAEALSHGYATVRITWRRLLKTPAHEAQRLHAILARRR